MLIGAEDQREAHEPRIGSESTKEEYPRPANKNGRSSEAAVNSLWMSKQHQATCFLSGRGKSRQGAIQQHAVTERATQATRRGWSN